MKFVVVSRPPIEKKRLVLRAGKIWREILARSGHRGEWHFVGLVFVSSPEMKRLNKQFRGKNYATDVLSFAPSEPQSLGELVFCTDVLKRQAKEHDLTFEQEFYYMLIHGLLHLLGYDHEGSARQAKRMFALQDAVFASLY